MYRSLFKFIIVMTCTMIISASSIVAAKKRQGTVMFGDQVDGTHITHLADLPDIDGLKQNGDYFDLGWAHTRVRFFMIPMWGSTIGNYVLYTKQGHGWEYYNISKADAAVYGEQAGLTLAQMPHVKFYQNNIGSILFLGLLSLLLILKIHAVSSRQKKLRMNEQKMESSGIQRVDKSREMTKIKNNLNYHRGKNIKIQNATSNANHRSIELQKSNASDGFGQR